MAERGLPRSLWLVPLLTVLVLSISVFTHRRGESFRFARVYGGPTVGSFCGRVQLAVEEEGLERSVAAEPLRVTWEQGRQSFVRQLRTDREGWADFCFGSPAGPETDSAGRFALYMAAEDPLIDADIELSRARWLRSVSKRESLVRLSGSGPYQIEGHLAPPVLSVPFGGTLYLETESPAELALSFSTEGLELPRDLPRRLARQHPIALPLVASGFSASLTVRAQVAEGEGQSVTTFQVPVVPGSFTFEREAPESDIVDVASPVAREAAYFAIVGPWGRGPGGRVELSPRADGTAHGRLDVKRALGTFAQIGRGQRYVVLSSSPDGRTPGLVGLPLDGQVETFDARDAFLYDGEAPARARARKEQKRIRAVLGAYAGLSGLVCLLLFAAHLRQAARTLDADLKRVGLSSAARDSGLGLPLLALFSLFFAFSLAVLWIVAR